MKQNINVNNQYIGRFAPSPTGRLHIGSLLCAVGSFLDARANNGQWLLRIEDIDPPREEAGAADDILRTLQAFALYWDGEVVYQSKRYHLYHEALDYLLEKGEVYPCYCSRKTVKENGIMGVDGVVYNGNCRKQSNIKSAGKNYAYRLYVDDDEILFNDRIVGFYKQDIKREVGDFVLLRADGLWAYQLAVVVDDAMCRVNHIVRGQDLLVSTPRQIYLSKRLNYKPIQYAHLPLLTNRQGQKWSKQTLAPHLDLNRKENLLRQVLIYLGLPEPIPADSCENILQWAIANWDIKRVPSNFIITEN